MRWAIGILLVLNLMVVMWHGFIVPGDDGTKPLPDPDVGSLRLLTELPPPDVDLGDAATQPLRQPVVAAKPTESVEKKPAAQKQLPPVEPVKPIVERKPVVTVPAPIKKAPVAELPEAVCWEFGSYPGESQAKTAAGALPLGLTSIGVVKGQAKRVTGYYVLIPAANDLKTAEGTVASLKEKQVRDTWLFRSGPLKNAISLGLFSQRHNAERLAASVRKKGFDAVLREKSTSREIYRLQVWGRDNELNARTVRKMSIEEPLRIPCP